MTPEQPVCGQPCKGLYNADTLCERPGGHNPPCAPAVLRVWAEKQEARLAVASLPVRMISPALMWLARRVGAPDQ